MEKYNWKLMFLCRYLENNLMRNVKYWNEIYFQAPRDISSHWSI